MNIKYPLITLSNYNLFPFVLNLGYFKKLNELTKMNHFIHTDWLSLDMKITTTKPPGGWGLRESVVPEMTKSKTSITRCREKPESVCLDQSER